MKLFELLFIFWAIGVALFWIGSTPESAPQQAALAGQALVLVCIPYCVLSVIQRTMGRDNTLELTQSLKRKPLELTQPLKRRPPVASPQRSSKSV